MTNIKEKRKPHLWSISAIFRRPSPEPTISNASPPPSLPPQKTAFSYNVIRIDLLDLLEFIRRSDQLTVWQKASFVTCIDFHCLTDETFSSTPLPRQHEIIQNVCRQLHSFIQQPPLAFSSSETANTRQRFFLSFLQSARTEGYFHQLNQRIEQEQERKQYASIAEELIHLSTDLRNTNTLTPAQKSLIRQKIKLDSLKTTSSQKEIDRALKQLETFIHSPPTMVLAVTPQHSQDTTIENFFKMCSRSKEYTCLRKTISVSNKRHSTKKEIDTERQKLEKMLEAKEKLVKETSERLKKLSRGIKKDKRLTQEQQRKMTEGLQLTNNEDIASIIEAIKRFINSPSPDPDNIINILQQKGAEKDSVLSTYWGDKDHQTLFMLHNNTKKLEGEIISKKDKIKDLESKLGNIQFVSETTKKSTPPLQAHERMRIAATDMTHTAFNQDSVLLSEEAATHAEEVSAFVKTERKRRHKSILHSFLHTSPSDPSKPHKRLFYSADQYWKDAAKTLKRTGHHDAWHTTYRPKEKKKADALSLRGHGQVNAHELTTVMEKNTPQESKFLFNTHLMLTLTVGQLFYMFFITYIFDYHHRLTPDKRNVLPSLQDTPGAELTI